VLKGKKVNYSLLRAVVALEAHDWLMLCGIREIYLERMIRLCWACIEGRGGWRMVNELSPELWGLRDMLKDLTNWRRIVDLDQVNGGF
jgi:hypothetical protein